MTKTLKSFTPLVRNTKDQEKQKGITKNRQIAKKNKGKEKIKVRRK